MENKIEHSYIHIATTAVANLLSVYMYTSLLSLFTHKSKMDSTNMPKFQL